MAQPEYDATNPDSVLPFVKAALGNREDYYKSRGLDPSGPGFMDLVVRRALGHSDTLEQYKRADEERDAIRTLILGTAAKHMLTAPKVGDVRNQFPNFPVNDNQMMDAPGPDREIGVVPVQGLDTYKGPLQDTTPRLTMAQAAGQMAKGPKNALGVADDYGVTEPRLALAREEGPQVVHETGEYVPEEVPMVEKTKVRVPNPEARLALSQMPYYNALVHQRGLKDSAKTHVSDAEYKDRLRQRADDLHMGAKPRYEGELQDIETDLGRIKGVERPGSPDARIKNADATIKEAQAPLAGRKELAEVEGKEAGTRKTTAETQTIEDLNTANLYVQEKLAKIQLDLANASTTVQRAAIMEERAKFTEMVGMMKNLISMSNRGWLSNEGIATALKGIWNGIAEMESKGNPETLMKFRDPTLMESIFPFAADPPIDLVPNPAYDPTRKRGYGITAPPLTPPPMAGPQKAPMVAPAPQAGNVSDPADKARADLIQMAAGMEEGEEREYKGYVWKKSNGKLDKVRKAK